MLLADRLQTQHMQLLETVHGNLGSVSCSEQRNGMEPSKSDRPLTASKVDQA